MYCDCLPSYILSSVSASFLCSASSKCEGAEAGLWPRISSKYLHVFLSLPVQLLLLLSFTVRYSAFSDFIFVLHCSQVLSNASSSRAFDRHIWDFSYIIIYVRRTALILRWRRTARRLTAHAHCRVKLKQGQQSACKRRVPGVLPVSYF